MKLAAFRDLTRFEQTFFGLPFILASLLLSLSCAAPSFRWLFVVPAFMLARVSGMAFNQLIDCKFDARNPRTVNRAIPAGRVTLIQARMVSWGSLLLFVLLCLQINFLTAILAPIAAFLFYIYSYMKRVHYACHAVLGIIHFLGPVMAFAAVTGSFSLSSCFLGGVAAFLIIGTDIAYALQDYEFDCKNQLFSVPSQFGIKKSIQISMWTHFLSLLALLGVGLSAHLPMLYYFLLPVAALIFIFFHLFLRKPRNEFINLEASFFYCNVAISFSVLIFIALSLVWRALL